MVLLEVKSKRAEPPGQMSQPLAVMPWLEWYFEEDALLAASCQG
jgi:hypothetical protein